jgi:hypothetical protein
MTDSKKPEDPGTADVNPRDAYGFQEAPAEQGLKKPPTDFGIGEDSGEWTRGGGSDPNERDEKG